MDSSFSYLRPSIPWALSVCCATLIAVAILMSATVFAALPIARYLTAVGVERIVLDRGACYGRCPAYRLTIRANGSASYTGEGFVRLRGTYETRFNPHAFGRFADVLYRRGMFSSRQANTVVDAPATTISVVFSNGTVADSVAYGFDANDLEDDMSASALYIDGFAGHLCDWHRVESQVQAGRLAGWYAPISTAPCR